MILTARILTTFPSTSCTSIVLLAIKSRTTTRRNKKSRRCLIVAIMHVDTPPCTRVVWKHKGVYVMANIMRIIIVLLFTGLTELFIHLWQFFHNLKIYLIDCHVNQLGWVGHFVFCSIRGPGIKLRTWRKRKSRMLITAKWCTKHMVQVDLDS